MERRRNRFEYENYAPGEARAGRVEGGRHRDRKYPKIPHPPYPDGPGIQRPTEPSYSTHPESRLDVQIDFNRFKGVKVFVQEWSTKPATVLVTECRTGQTWVLPKDCLSGLTVDEIEAAACENCEMTRRLGLARDDIDLERFYLEKIADLERENEELRARVTAIEDSRSKGVLSTTRGPEVRKSTSSLGDDGQTVLLPSQCELDDARRKLAERFRAS